MSSSWHTQKKIKSFWYWQQKRSRTNGSRMQHSGWPLPLDAGRLRATERRRPAPVGSLLFRVLNYTKCGGNLLFFIALLQSRNEINCRREVPLSPIFFSPFLPHRPSIVQHSNNNNNMAFVQMTSNFVSFSWLIAVGLNLSLSVLHLFLLYAYTVTEICWWHQNFNSAQFSFPFSICSSWWVFFFFFYFLLS